MAYILFMLPTIVSSTLLILAVIAAILVVIYTLRFGISPMPSSRAARDAMLRLLKEQNVKGPIYELGAGWGTLACALANTFPHCRIVAYEISPVPWILLRLRHMLRHRPNLVVHRKDFIQYSLSNAGSVTCYLFPGGMRRLEQKLDQEAPDGCFIVSNTFALPTWKAQKEVVLPDMYRTRIRLYCKQTGTNITTLHEP